MNILLYSGDLILIIYQVLDYEQNGVIYITKSNRQKTNLKLFQENEYKLHNKFQKI